MARSYLDRGRSASAAHPPLRRGAGLRMLRSYDALPGRSTPSADGERSMDGGADARRITIYQPEDFAGMRAAGRLAAETLDMIAPHVQPGVTTGELDQLCHDFMLDAWRHLRPAELPRVSRSRSAPRSTMWSAMASRASGGWRTATS